MLFLKTRLRLHDKICANILRHICLLYGTEHLNSNTFIGKFKNKDSKKSFVKIIQAVERLQLLLFLVKLYKRFPNWALQACGIWS